MANEARWDNTGEGENRAPVPPQHSEILEQVLSETCANLNEQERQEARTQIATLLDEIERGAVRVSVDLEATIGARIADVDELIASQVNEILHSPEFQGLESSWRGLHHLVRNVDAGAVKVRLLAASKKDLLDDLERAVDFDSSGLFWKVYEEEYGTLGGEPFGVLVVDCQFGHEPQDVTLLQHLASVAAAAHSPVLASVNPSMFGWDDFRDLSLPRDLARIFSTVDYAKWKAFRDSEDSRYVALTLPRVLLREPYNLDNAATTSFRFEEDSQGTDLQKYLFGSAAYVLAGKIAEAFAKFGWCAAIRGVSGGGLVENLPDLSFGTDKAGIAPKGPVEIDVTDLREKELADLGFVPIVHCKDTSAAVFYSTPSCQKPRLYDREDANINAQLSAQLQYILCTSRFAHYLKVMMREKIGSTMNASDCETFLNTWLSQYCLANPEDAGEEEKARRPLREARVQVRDVRGKPGSYDAVVYLLPHYQLDELTVSLRLVTALRVAERTG